MQCMYPTTKQALLLFFICIEQGSPAFLYDGRSPQARIHRGQYKRPCNIASPSYPQPPVPGRCLQARVFGMDVSTTASGELHMTQFKGFGACPCRRKS